MASQTTVATFSGLVITLLLVLDHARCKSIIGECTSSQFACDGSSCIERELVCNNITNCEDLSDEIGCECLKIGKLSCGNEALCVSPENYCINNVMCEQMKGDVDCSAIDISTTEESTTDMPMTNSPVINIILDSNGAINTNHQNREVHSESEVVTLPSETDPITQSTCELVDLLSCDGTSENCISREDYCNGNIECAILEKTMCTTHEEITMQHNDEDKHSHDINIVTIIKDKTHLNETTHPDHNITEEHHETHAEIPDEDIVHVSIKPVEHKENTVSSANDMETANIHDEGMNTESSLDIQENETSMSDGIKEHTMDHHEEPTMSHGMQENTMDLHERTAKSHVENTHNETLDNVEEITTMSPMELLHNDNDHINKEDVTIMLEGTHELIVDHQLENTKEDLKMPLDKIHEDDMERMTKEMLEHTKDHQQDTSNNGETLMEEVEMAEERVLDLAHHDKVANDNMDHTEEHVHDLLLQKEVTMNTMDHAKEHDHDSAHHEQVAIDTMDHVEEHNHDLSHHEEVTVNNMDHAEEHVHDLLLQKDVTMNTMDHAKEHAHDSAHHEQVAVDTMDHVEEHNHDLSHHEEVTVNNKDHAEEHVHDSSHPEVVTINTMDHAEEHVHDSSQPEVATMNTMDHAEEHVHDSSHPEEVTMDTMNHAEEHVHDSSTVEKVTMNTIDRAEEHIHDSTDHEDVGMNIIDHALEHIMEADIVHENSVHDIDTHNKEKTVDDDEHEINIMESVIPDEHHMHKHSKDQLAETMHDHGEIIDEDMETSNMDDHMTTEHLTLVESIDNEDLTTEITMHSSKENAAMIENISNEERSENNEIGPDNSLDESMTAHEKDKSNMGRSEDISENEINNDDISPAVKQSLKLEESMEDDSVSYMKIYIPVAVIGIAVAVILVAWVVRNNGKRADSYSVH